MQIEQPQNHTITRGLQKFGHCGSISRMQRLIQKYFIVDFRNIHRIQKYMYLIGHGILLTQRPSAEIFLKIWQ